MNKTLSIFSVLLFMTVTALADNIFEEKRAGWLQKAEACKPELKVRTMSPTRIIQPVKDDKAYQGWTFKTDGMKLEDFYNTNFREKRSVIVDFGEHLTGYCTIHIKTLSSIMDAPVRLKLTFCEMPAEMNTPLDPWKGSLSRAWMQDEIVTVEYSDRDVRLPRRVAMRYLKIELLGSSASYNFAINKISFDAETSAGEIKTTLRPDCPEMIRNINNVAIATLKECMQTVYEDGPKRDRRLWIGDMYLESLANRYSFKNNQITKRCLYLFAGLCAKNGVLICNIYERPDARAMEWNYLPSYNLLYNATLLEYYKDTEDLETVKDLWPLAKRQIDDVLECVGDNYLYDKSKRAAWLFFDWREGLDIDACMQACTICGLDDICELAKIAGKETEVKDYPALAKKMRAAAKKAMYDKKSGVIKSGKDGQVSVLSQTWMIRAGVLNAKEGQTAIRTALASSTTVMPGTPYATHYLIDAMLQCGMNEEARNYLTEYWGGMVKKGADTFFEAYDPKDDFISPYRFFPVNSYCHAWSCTPMYFIHKYPEIFQK